MAFLGNWAPFWRASNKLCGRVHSRRSSSHFMAATTTVCSMFVAKLLSDLQLLACSSSPCPHPVVGLVSWKNKGGKQTFDIPALISLAQPIISSAIENDDWIKVGLQELKITAPLISHQLYKPKWRTCREWSTNLKHDDSRPGPPGRVLSPTVWPKGFFFFFFFYRWFSEWKGRAPDAKSLHSRWWPPFLLARSVANRRARKQKRR